MPDDKTQPETVSVTSYNQSGGITAHTVNINRPPQRIMSDELKRQLLSDPKIPAGSQIFVFLTGHGLEPRNFGKEIVEFLQSNGYRPQLLPNAFASLPPAPLTVRYDKTVSIFVGDNS
ncbi:MAG: hypothetical protein ABSC92_15890 [Rhizomicrobium sp.]|jgi:hypothetical protein